MESAGWTGDLDFIRVLAVGSNLKILISTMCTIFFLKLTRKL